MRLLRQISHRNAEDPFKQDIYHSRDTRDQLTVYTNANQAL